MYIVRENISDKLTSEQRVRGHGVFGYLEECSKQRNSKHEAVFLLLLFSSTGVEPSPSCVLGKDCNTREGLMHSCLGQSEWGLEAIVGGKVREHTGKQGLITLG